MDFNSLKKTLKGDLEDNLLYRTIYATDASSYREIPLGVAYPKDKEDVKAILHFAHQNGISIIPRAAGTSLAGQVVGEGLVVDISKYMDKILEIHEEEHWVRVEPGVVLDELHLYTKPYGLFFGPETSTSNRCCLGGMVGNNSCGLHSLVYGSTRDHLLEATVILSDGSESVLKDITLDRIAQIISQETLESSIYSKTIDILRSNIDLISSNYPDKAIHRRNTGYALDQLIDTNIIDPNEQKRFNLCRLLAGSEGTLGIIVELKLNLIPLPPKERVIICVHCSSLEEAFYGNLIALKHTPFAIELMDRKILELSKNNISQSKNRFFIKGEPEAILIIELSDNQKSGLESQADLLEQDLQKNNYGYHFARLYGEDINKIWNLRKAGLGLLSNMPGSAKPVSVIEDTAVAPNNLPDYIRDFKQMLLKYNLECVYHAHIATGELHLRPILDLKKEQDIILYKQLATETAHLVKKYNGSLSGEHGDGRLRGEFIPLMYGEHIYNLFKKIKEIWDPKNILNPGKIINTPPMDKMLRYTLQGVNNERKNASKLTKTYFDFSEEKGWLSAIEQCNGSGDCRKKSIFKGTMCPSFRATNDEKNTTRSRANILREFLTNPQTSKIFDQKEILEVLETCLSCKACKSECPSNVDMAKFKAEFLQHHFDTCGTPLKSCLIGNLNKIQKFGSLFPSVYNFFITNRISSYVIKNMLGFSKNRNLPIICKQTFQTWFRKNYKPNPKPIKTIYFFSDEFINYLDVQVGIAFVRLLTRLNYNIIIPNHTESGRAAISKGLLKKAKKIANLNVRRLKDLISQTSPLVGLEPSCILSFRDEYPILVKQELQKEAINLSQNCLLYDEFILKEIKLGNISSHEFQSDHLEIKLHGHCHQKALASIEPSKAILSLLQNASVDIIPSGCCGMAGSFGYESIKYDLSMAIGEQILFPAIRSALGNTIIAAPGSSCRQQIYDGTGRVALHPVEILWNTLKKN